MRLKIISCELFKLYIDYFGLNKDNHQIVYLDIYSHDQPLQLRQKIQDEINKASDCDKIVLLYGICGNALRGIYTNNLDVVIPRFHDCSQILLGSMERFRMIFGSDLSRPWSCANYNSAQTSKFVSYEENPLFLDLVKNYGKDNAVYIYELMYVSHYDDELYIDFGMDIDCEKKACRDYRIIEGDLRILKKVFSGDFSDDFVVLSKSQKLRLIYDLDVVLDIEV